MSETWNIWLETGNAAFEDEPATEIARILRDLADKFDRGEAHGDSMPLRDINGNRCGAVVIGD